jgi:hypothetical protein
MKPVQLIQSVEQEECFFQSEGNNFRIINGNHHPDSLKDGLIINKDLVLEIVERDRKAKQAGFVIGISGELYTLTLNRKSTIYMEKIENKWQAWRETYQKNRVKAVSYKIISTSESFELVVLKAKSFLNYLGKIQGQ